MLDKKKISIPKTMVLKKITRETPSINTYFFEHEIEIEPGQFVMLWLPGIDEKPFAISYQNKKEIGISIQHRGKFTEAMEKLKKGNLVGIRGPFGKAFETKGVKKAVIVSGGCGAAAISLLAKKLKSQKTKTKFILGAKTKSELLMEKKLKPLCELQITTDDGSHGIKGFTTQELEKILQKEKVDCVFSCGPEKMMQKVFQLCEKHKTKCQLSLERFMKCGGMGICGACEIDGWLVCKDGPVFSNEQLRKMPSFGKSFREKSGKKIF